MTVLMGFTSNHTSSNAASNRTTRSKPISALNAVRNTLRLPVLTSIPFSAQYFNATRARKYSMQYNGLITDDCQLEAPTANAISELAQQLHGSLSDQLQSLCITGVGNKAGRSSIAMLLANELTKYDLKILLVNGDLDKCMLRTYVGKQRHVGLAEVVASNQNLSTAIQPTSAENLDFLSRGNPIADRLMRNEVFDQQQWLAQATQTYDLVIVDAAPFNKTTSDNDRAIVDACDANVLVVNQQHFGAWSKLALSNTIGALKSRSLGYVLNQSSN